MPKILSQLIGMLTTSEQVDKADKFVRQNQWQGNEKLQKALKSANANLKWAENNIPKIINYLEKKDTNRATMNKISGFSLLTALFISIFFFQ